MQVSSGRGAALSVRVTLRDSHKSSLRIFNTAFHFLTGYYQSKTQRAARSAALDFQRRVLPFLRIKLLRAALQI